MKKKYLTMALGKSTKKERGEWRAKINLMDAILVGDDGEIDLMDTSNADEDGDEGAEYTKEAKSAQGLKAAKLIKRNTIVAEVTKPPLL